MDTNQINEMISSEQPSLRAQIVTWSLSLGLLIAILVPTFF